MKHLMQSMRTLLSLLVVLSFSLVDLARSPAAAWAATAGAASPGPHAVQARAKKKKRPRPAKVKSADKKPEKAKKNDRGFEL